jgi:hypothetical protein
MIAGRGLGAFTCRMFSHVVIFWVKPGVADGADQLLAGMEKYLRPIPGVLSIHMGRMVPSHRAVVDQSYQVGLNLVFSDKKAQDDYQIHPLHLDFVEKVFKKVCERVVIYDFA